MFKKASMLSDREAICGKNIIDKLLKHKAASRNLIVVTHNTCMKDLVRTSGQKYSWNPEHGSPPLSKNKKKGKQIIDILNADNIPKKPSAI
ncbi:hypothetical protein OOJ96_02665 [Pseudomonas sp. 15FMM2]|uniref:Uncharacterized protein n=1 Tax=Pseudomonas imrae TaxID=2992837 RepID=A0ACC7P9S6_9PSED